MDLAGGFVKGNVRFGVMRRRLSLALASAIIALASAGFVSGDRSAAERHATERALTSPLVELQAVPATTPKAGALAAFSGAVALLSVAAAVAAAGAGYVLQASRGRRAPAATLAWSAPRRGPPRLAAR